MTRLSKSVATGLASLSLGILVLSMPVSAQDNTVTSPNNAAPGDTAVYRDGEADRGQRAFDWGWIGLLGLIGLAGRLANKRSEHRTSH
ncbi:WGxxGxxG family protein [Chlorogloea sp. CCALA 695]|uniref:WGxxGxxG family protein n=1 Tax=Chlorogloea sp. CCALA 695 TaxID=2107693 RepID=UPI0018EDC072|nr:WGxxGxxG family protein [Chlorogloea sp. CCALA 695]